MTEQTPHSLSAEAAVLGSMIIDPSYIESVLEIVGKDSFYFYGHQILFEAITSAYETYMDLDLILVRNTLESEHQIDNIVPKGIQVGGLDYLPRIVNSVAVVSNAVYYAKVVDEKYRRRRLIQTANNVLERSDVDDIDTIITDAVDRLEKIGEVDAADSTPLNEVAQNVFTVIEHDSKEGSSGIDTGVPPIDSTLSPIEKPSYFVLAARPSVGKTALALQMAIEMANGHIPVLFVSYEMREEQLGYRALAMKTGLTYKTLRNAWLSDKNWRQVVDGVGELDISTLQIIDDGPHIDTLKHTIKRKTRDGVQVIFIDYLQCIPSRGDREYEQVSYASWVLKNLAKETNTIIVCLSQLNRGPEGRSDNRPRMADLRTSGTIEQNADIVGLLHRPDRDKAEEDGMAQLIIAKARNAETGIIRLSFDKKRMQFGELVI